MPDVYSQTENRVLLFCDAVLRHLFLLLFGSRFFSDWDFKLLLCNINHHIKCTSMQLYSVQVYCVLLCILEPRSLTRFALLLWPCSHCHICGKGPARYRFVLSTFSALSCSHLSALDPLHEQILHYNRLVHFLRGILFCTRTSLFVG